MIMRRLLVVLVAATALLLPTPAGASGNLGWRSTASGSADTNQDGTHIVSFRYGPNFSSVHLAFDSWKPTWCELYWVADGDAQGRPLQFLWASNDPNRACIPWGNAWGDGTGYAEGIMGAGYPVDVGEVTVFPRTGPWARGTMWVIW